MPRLCDLGSVVFPWSDDFVDTVVVVWTWCVSGSLGG